MRNNLCCLFALVLSAFVFAACIDDGILRDDGQGGIVPAPISATGKIQGIARYRNMGVNDNEGILVTLKRTDDEDTPSDEGESLDSKETKPDGSFIFYNQEIGGYKLIAHGYDTLEPLVWVETAVVPGLETNLAPDLLLTAVGIVTGKITAADGASADFSVYIAGTTYSTKLDKDGSFTITVPAGSHTFLIGSYESESFTVEKGSTNNLGERTLTIAELEAERTFILAYAEDGGTLSGGTAAGDVRISKLVMLHPSGAKTGYTLVDYTLSGPESGEKEPGETFRMPAGDVTATANWKPIIYTIAYDANGGSGATASSIHTYDEEKTLTANGFTRTGYTFAGWSTSSGGKVEYANSQSVTNLSSTAGTVTLYAQWTPITYTIAYNANGGSGTMASSTHTYDTAKTLTANGFTRTGYTFMGWASSSGGGVVYADSQSVKNLSSTAGVTITLYAVWHKDSVITVTLSGGPQGETIGWSNTPAASIDWTDNGSLTVTVNTAAGQWANGAAFKWYMDGGEVSIGAAAAITIKAQNYALGTHTLTVKVTKGGASYTKTVWFTVVE